MKPSILCSMIACLLFSGAGAADETSGTILGVSKVAYLKGMETPPTVLKRVAPVYPRALREKGIQGVAMVEVRVDSSGQVIETALVRATRPEFGQRALDAALAWTFQPATARGTPIGARVRLSFEFVMPQVAAMERH